MFGRSLQISITLCVCCMCCGFQTEKREIGMCSCLFSADRTWFFAHEAANVCVRCIWVTIPTTSSSSSFEIGLELWTKTHRFFELKSTTDTIYSCDASKYTRNTNLSSNNAVIIFNEGEKTQINTLIQKQIVSLFLWFLCQKTEKK